LKRRIKISPSSQFWQARIKLTQAPKPFEFEIFPEDPTDSYRVPEYSRSFLCDPFRDDPYLTYGLELSLSKNIEWVFYTSFQEKELALEIGLAWLAFLRFRFKGLDGELNLKLIEPQESEKYDEIELFEIIIPDGILRKQINILEKLINVFYHEKDKGFQIFLIWQRFKYEHEKMQDSFRFRVIVKYNKNNFDKRNLIRLKASLRFLGSEIVDNQDKYFKIIHPTDIRYLDILGTKVFSKDEYSPNYLSTNYTLLDEQLINFDFPEEMALPTIPILQKEIVRYIDLDEYFISNAVSIGNHIRNGIITNHKTYVPIKKLPQDMAIFGKPGSGKTFFLARFIEELSKKAKDVGILVLNVAKESQEQFYPKFEKIKYASNKLTIPYYFERGSQEKCLQETATYICASLGLKNVVEKIIYHTMRTFLDTKGKLPDKLIDLLIGVEAYIQQNPYGKDTQANLVQALRNRIKIFDDEYILNVTELSDSIPEWIFRWLNGQNIFLDLSSCNKFTKMLLICAIFQLIRCVTHDSEVENLKNIIVIDEAHAVVEKPITRNSDDADFILKEQLAKIFSNIMKEYRSRGIGMIIVDQSPSRLFDDVVSQPSIKIIFRQDYPNNLLFSEAPYERQMLTQLPNRIAFVMNGSIGEKYLIKTIEFKKNS